MSVHKATIEWRRDTESFKYTDYTRNHVWRFDETTIAASAAPGFLGDATRLDPEEAYVASLSSCHMLTFLAVASKKGYIVDNYTDQATGVLAKNNEGKMCITHVTLRPTVVFSGDRLPDANAIDRIHELSHQECFIANSVNTKVTVEQQTT